MERDHPDISTEHQPDGDARHPSDTLDRNPRDRPKGSKIDSNTADIDEKGRPRPPAGGPR